MSVPIIVSIYSTIGVVYTKTCSDYPTVLNNLAQVWLESVPPVFKVKVKTIFCDKLAAGEHVKYLA